MRRAGWALLALLLVACQPPPSDMVAVEGGTFVAGSAALPSHDNPERTATVADFFIERTEVSVGAYGACVEAGACGAAVIDAAALRRLELPVTGVTWRDAVAFCTWRGRRLPTENEWERAARGAANRLFPWGDAYLPDAANGAQARACIQDGVVYRFAAPPGCFARDRSSWGALDLAGNVAEWVADAYSPVPGVNPDPTLGVVKGGYYYAEPTQLSGAWREPAAVDARSMRTGFRCAVDAN